MADKSIKDYLEEFKGIGFLSKKAGSFSSVPQRTVQSWTEKGLLIADKAETSGTGKRRSYSTLNCVEIGIIRSLTEERLTLQIISSAMRNLREKIPNEKKSKLERLLEEDEGYLILQIGTDHLITNPQESIMGYSKGERINLLEWQYMTTPKTSDKTIIVNVTRIAKKVFGRIN